MIISTPGDEMERREKNGRTRCASKVDSASDRPEHADQAAKSCPFALFATPERAMAGSGCAGWSAFQYHSETGESGNPCLFLTDKQRPRGPPCSVLCCGTMATAHGSMAVSYHGSRPHRPRSIITYHRYSLLTRCDDNCCDTAAILLKC